MITSQLGRLLLTGSSGSPDEQDARPDDTGSYGELVTAIERIVEQLEEQPES